MGSDPLQSVRRRAHHRLGPGTSHAHRGTSNERLADGVRFVTRPTSITERDGAESTGQGRRATSSCARHGRACRSGVREEAPQAREVQLAMSANGDHRRVPPPDLLIAATAELANVPLVHYDRDYERIAAARRRSTPGSSPTAHSVRARRGRDRAEPRRRRSSQHGDRLIAERDTADVAVPRSRPPALARGGATSSRVWTVRYGSCASASPCVCIGTACSPLPRAHGPPGSAATRKCDRQCGQDAGSRTRR